MTFERHVRLARLPEMRIAYFEHQGPVEEIPQLWERFDAWRLQARPAVGRPDIATIGWLMNPGADEGEPVTYRAGVPIRSDAGASPPAKSTFFPGGTFAYCYADDTSEIEAAFEAVSDWLEREEGWSVRSAMELYKYHYNLEQHPADCGFILDRA
jgi:DNA gyrase inhibitor GyrI